MGSQLDKKFEQLITGMVKVEKAVAEAMKDQNAPKPWINFAGDDIPAEQRPDDKKETSLKQTFNRDDVEQNYVKYRSDEDAKSSDIATVKIAGDFMAACERDKRMQWRSRIRMIAHAAARRAGNGFDSGPLKRNTTDYISRTYLKATLREV